MTRDPDAIVQHPHTISNTSTSLQTGIIGRHSLLREALLQTAAVGSNHIAQCNYHICLNALCCAAALQLNLARALMRGGGSSEAVQLYEELEVTAGAAGRQAGGWQATWCMPA